MAGIIAVITCDTNAAVVQRSQPTAQATKPGPRANNASRMPTLVANATNTTNATNVTSNPDTETNVVDESEIIIEDEEIETTSVDDEQIIENKSAQFAETFSDLINQTPDSSSSNLANKIKQQRDALNAQSSADVASNTQAALLSGKSSCDTDLRECMQKKCGESFEKCANDGDTIWGDKMDACRRTTKCTAHQYLVFSREIKADRDMSVGLASFENIIKCGNEYNSCIVSQCGEKYTKCLGKSATDAAIAACAKVANKCKTYDSGLAARAMEVIGNFRLYAENQVAIDEKRLYELRKQMSSVCERLGAMFDERSLVCVYTVNFFAGDLSSPKASKKLYSGASFNCDQDWFGINLTTYKENAYRETRSQNAASASFMGAGLGTAASMITSGQISRAIDTKKAKDALKKAQKEHTENFENNEEENVLLPNVAEQEPDGDESDNNKGNKKNKEADKGTPAKGEDKGTPTKGDTGTKKQTPGQQFAAQNGDAMADIKKKTDSITSKDDKLKQTVNKTKDSKIETPKTKSTLGQTKPLGSSVKTPTISTSKPSGSGSAAKPAGTGGAK